MNVHQNRYVIFRDVHSGLEYIRSTEEIRDKGLYFELDAYAYHVFMDFHEVNDNDSGQYRHLANYLNGRGVPSISEAIRELMLAPVLNPLRELINPANLKKIYQTRIVVEKNKLNSEVLNVQTEKYRYLIQAINSFVDGHQNLDAILQEMQSGLEVILKLPVFETRYPFPGSKQYKEMITYIQGNLAAYPFIWYVLTIWNDLRLIGRVKTPDRSYAEISRSWLDEWGIARLTGNTLEQLGLDSGQAQSGVTILKLLVSQQNWIEDIHSDTALSLMERWLSTEEIRTFLNVNRYHDKLWFNKEAFESMMWWMMTIALVTVVSDPEKSLTEAVEILFEAYSLIQELLDAEIEF